MSSCAGVIDSLDVSSYLRSDDEYEAEYSEFSEEEDSNSTVTTPSSNSSMVTTPSSNRSTRVKHGKVTSTPAASSGSSNHGPAQSSSSSNGTGFGPRVKNGKVTSIPDSNHHGPAQPLVSSSSMPASSSGSTQSSSSATGNESDSKVPTKWYTSYDLYLQSEQQRRKEQETQEKELLQQHFQRWKDLELYTKKLLASSSGSSHHGRAQSLSSSSSNGIGFGPRSDQPHNFSPPPPRPHSGPYRRGKIRGHTSLKEKPKKKRSRKNHTARRECASGPPTSMVSTHKKARITTPSYEPSCERDTQRAGGSDGGGCILKALNKCCPGVLTAEDLDEQIMAVFEEKNALAEWSPNGFKEEWCGTPGESWHQDCIVKALKKKYPGGYSWRKHPTSVIYERGHGKFYVHGILNKLLWPDLDQEGNWQHAICVDTDTGRFWDDNAKGRKVEKWLKCEVETDRWMEEIWRVYKLEVPSLAD